jgi:hypothetical protein
MPKRGRKSQRSSSSNRTGRSSLTQGGSLSTRMFPSIGINRPMDTVQTLVVQTPFTSSLSATTFTSWPISLSGFDQVATIIALYDQYRFIAADYEFKPVYDGNTNVGFTADPGLFASVVDTTDSTVLTSFAAATDYSTCRVSSSTKPHKHRFIPQCLVSSNGLLASQQWVSTSANTLAFNGVKTAWTATVPVLGMRLIIRVHMQFRNLR